MTVGRASVGARVVAGVVSPQVSDAGKGRRRRRRTASSGEMRSWSLPSSHSAKCADGKRRCGRSLGMRELRRALAPKGRAPRSGRRVHASPPAACSWPRLAAASTKAKKQPRCALGIGASGRISRSEPPRIAVSTTTRQCACGGAAATAASKAEGARKPHASSPPPSHPRSAAARCSSVGCPAKDAATASDADDISPSAALGAKRSGGIGRRGVKLGGGSSVQRRLHLPMTRFPPSCTWLRKTPPRAVQFASSMLRCMKMSGCSGGKGGGGGGGGGGPARGALSRPVVAAALRTVRGSVRC